MSLRIAFVAALLLAGVTQVAADFTGANGEDYANCLSSAGLWNGNVHDPDEVLEPSQFWDQKPGNADDSQMANGDFSGFKNPSVLELTIAVPTYYEGDRTHAEFVDADSSGETAQDMCCADAACATTLTWDGVASCIVPGSDKWLCHTDQVWASGEVDPGSTDFVVDHDCFSVYQLTTSWSDFVTDLGAGLAHTTYANYDVTQSSQADAANQTGAGAVAGNFEEYCGELSVTMYEEFIDTGLSTDPIDIDRLVTDKYIFCIVFSTHVEAAVNITIFDAPGYFQLLQTQAVGTLTPGSANCAADVDVNIVTITQWPYRLIDFKVTAYTATEAGNDYLNPDSSGASYTALLGGGGHAPGGPYCTNSFAPGDAYSSNVCDTSSGNWGPTAARPTLGSCDNGPTNAAGSCMQDWPVDFCNLLCEADGTLTITFEATCRDAISAADCPLSTNNAGAIDTQTVGGVVTLDTASYCAMLIESVEATGTLAAYDDPELVTPRTDFLTETMAYFKGQFTTTDANAPQVVGVCPMSVNIASFAGGAIGGTPPVLASSLLWSGDANYDAADGFMDGNGIACTGAGTHPGSTGYDGCTALGNTVSFHMYNYADDHTGAGAGGVECTALLNPIPAALADAETDLIGFEFNLDAAVLAPPTHGTFILQVTFVGEVIFADTTKKLLSIVHEYKQFNYDNYAIANPNEVGFLQLQDGPQNLMEVGAQIGAFDPFPDEDPAVEGENNGPDSGNVVIGGEENVAGTGEASTEIWPIIAGVVGGVTVCIIVLLIALRRRQAKKKVKTVAVIPDAKDYGPVAIDVAGTENDSESP